MAHRRANMRVSESRNVRLSALHVQGFQCQYQVLSASPLAKPVDKVLDTAKACAYLALVGWTDEGCPEPVLGFASSVFRMIFTHFFAPLSQVLAGGRLVRPEGGGQFYAPTVLAGVTPAMRIWREEVFGPVRSLPRLRPFTVPGLPQTVLEIPGHQPCANGVVARAQVSTGTATHTNNIGSEQEKLTCHALHAPTWGTCVRQGDGGGALQHRRRGGGAGQRLRFWTGLGCVFAQPAPRERHWRAPGGAQGRTLSGVCL